MRIYLSLLFVLVALPVLAQQEVAASEPLVVTVGIDHAPPYRIVQDAQRSGLYVDIFEALASRLGWQVRYREAPFRRTLWLAQKGRVDVLLGPAKTPERESFMAFEVLAFPPEDLRFFYQTGTDRIERYDDLYGRVIGLLEDTRYVPRLDGDDKLFKEYAPHYENLLLMMEKGRVDVVVAPELVGLNAVRTLDLTVSMSPFRLPGDPAYIAVSRGSPVIEHITELKAALDTLEQEGIYQELVLKYQERLSL